VVDDGLIKEGRGGVRLHASRVRTSKRQVSRMRWLLQIFFRGRGRQLDDPNIVWSSTYPPHHGSDVLHARSYLHMSDNAHQGIYGYHAAGRE
jgi:hypothetical protein